jgi:hypothetical protein
MGISYKHFLYGAITFVSLLMALLKISYFQTTGRGPMEFYFGVLFLTFLAWAGGQLWQIHTREEEAKWSPGSGEAVSLPEQDRPDEDTLIAAETYLNMGESLDMVCQFVNARYRDWDAPKKLAYRQGLRTVLDERRANTSGEQREADGLT